MRAAAELGRAADGPEIAEDVSGMRKGNVDGLGVREVADIVEEHRERSCEGTAWGRGVARRRRGCEL